MLLKIHRFKEKVAVNAKKYDSGEKEELHKVGNYRYILWFEKSQNQYSMSLDFCYFKMNIR